MKIMLDTNVLISALIFGGKPQEVIGKLLVAGNEIYVSEYVDQEFRDIIHMKWPQKEKQLIKLYDKMMFIHCASTDKRLAELRDEKDIPVLSDAMHYKMDILLTGDKDFLEADIDHPLILSPGMMSDYLDSRTI